MEATLKFAILTCEAAAGEILVLTASLSSPTIIKVQQDYYN